MKVDIWKIEHTNKNLVFGMDFRSSKFVITSGQKDRDRAKSLSLKFIGNVFVNKDDEMATISKLERDREWVYELSKNKLICEMSGVSLSKSEDEQLLYEILLS